MGELYCKVAIGFIPTFRPDWCVVSAWAFRVALCGGAAHGAHLVPAVALAVRVGSVGAGRPRVVLGLAVVAVGGEFAFEKPAAEVAGMLARAEARAGRAAEGAGGVADLRLTVRALPERSSPHSVSHSNPIFIWRFCMGVAGA